MKILTLVLLLLHIVPASAQVMQEGESIAVESPDKKLLVKFALTPQGEPMYRIRFGGKTVIAPSVLGLEVKDERLSAGFRVDKIDRRTIDETYPLVAGKAATARNQCNELVVRLKPISVKRRSMPASRNLTLYFRAYNDGAAFRYELPTRAASGAATPAEIAEMVEELTTFALAPQDTCWALQLGSFTSSYEKEFDKIPVSKLSDTAIAGLPLTLSLANGLTACITEAALKNYAGMYVAGSTAGAKENAALLRVRLSPLPQVPSQPSQVLGDKKICVKTPLPMMTPWRVVMVAEQATHLLESNLVLNLNPPSMVKNPAWIKAGKCAWDWWSDQLVSKQKAGMTTAMIKYYIAFASDYKLDYMMIDAGWCGAFDDLTADITKPIAAVDMPEVLRYAKEKNVGILLWLNWKTVAGRVREAFALYQQWGVKGVKIDYMDRDDQEMVGFYHSVLDTAAQYELLVDFHGAYKPTGERRTYPHFVTSEGIMGQEYTKWSDRITPVHNVTIPFTRMLAGPMDYTPGAFRSVAPDKFKAQFTAPVVMTTRAHQLAMFVVYESLLQMCCDAPDAYRNEPAAEFIKAVPASWDETKAVAGDIGKFIVMARRSGSRWFVGAMTDWNARTVRVPLTFMDGKKYRATLYTDGAGALNSKNRNEVRIRTRSVSASDTLTIEMPSGGGGAVEFVPEK